MDNQINVSEETQREIEAFETIEKYKDYFQIVDEAFAVVATGKGKERHNPRKLPFSEQQIVKVNLALGSTHGLLYQIIKKADESSRLPHPMSRKELLDIINYGIAAVIVLDKLVSLVETQGNKND